MLTTILDTVAIGIIGYSYCYNGLVSSRQKVDQGWPCITVQLKRRHELVPNLVKAARIAMRHESGILDRILEARTEALDALASGDHDTVNMAEGELTSALQGFVGYFEDNPEITATENIRLLQKQLEETEDQIAASRRLFNGNVQACNTKVLSIPWNFITSRKNFKTVPMFTADQTEMKVLSKSIHLAEPDTGGKAR